MFNEHRNIVSATAHVRFRLRRNLRRRNRGGGLVVLLLRRTATAEDLRTGQRALADGGALAGPRTEPSRRGPRACAALPRTLFHPLARQGGHRVQCRTRPADGRQKRLVLLQGLAGEGILQPPDRGQCLADGQSGQHPLRFQPLSLRGYDLCTAAYPAREHRHGAVARHDVPSGERLPLGQQPAGIHGRSAEHRREQRHCNL